MADDANLEGINLVAKFLHLNAVPNTKYEPSKSDFASMSNVDSDFKCTHI